MFRSLSDDRYFWNRNFRHSRFELRQELFRIQHIVCLKILKNEQLFQHPISWIWLTDWWRNWIWIVVIILRMSWVWVQINVGIGGVVYRLYFGFWLRLILMDYLLSISDSTMDARNGWMNLCGFGVCPLFVRGEEAYIFIQFSREK